MTVQQRSLWIPVPADLRVLVLVSAHPKLRSFVRLCAWFILSLGPKPPLAHYPAFIVCLATTSLLESIHKWKNPKMWLLRTCTCPRFRKTRSLSHQRSPGPGLVLSRGIWGLLLHSATTPVALQRGIYSFLLPLSWERQWGLGLRSKFSVYARRGRAKF